MSLAVDTLYADPPLPVAAGGIVAAIMESSDDAIVSETLDGKIETPDGRCPIVRTIWIVDRGLESPRLVTAYPSGD